MLSPAEETDKPTEIQQGRSSSRERSLTEKGQVMHEETAKKNEKAFTKAYDSWKELAKELRTKLKTFCSTEDLDTRLKRSKPKKPEICDLTSKRLENIDAIFNDRLEKERVRMVLNKEEYESVFGNTETETAFSESLQGSDSSSRATSRSSSRRAEADLAPKIEQAKAMQQMREQQAKLNKLESKLKLKEAQMLAEIKLKLDEEKTRLQQL
ncbi:Hypothetical predicted protein [Pelobates cultripes]|uniref:Uncharacterized protein n=1 Tax=Pelobates cultripes TaxID=61616 RepID=A0AAD1VYX1_PELCU|nr:Hypothetical predicted protein [Pelobates cultripes]